VGIKLGYDWNARPFDIADNVGRDTFALVGKFMKPVGGEDDLLPSLVLGGARMVADGPIWARRGGKSFYRYALEGKRLP
jgi:hypothetical protein